MDLFSDNGLWLLIAWATSAKFVLHLQFVFYLPFSPRAAKVKVPELKLLGLVGRKMIAIIE